MLRREYQTLVYFQGCCWVLKVVACFKRWPSVNLTAMWQCVIIRVSFIRQRDESLLFDMQRPIFGFPFNLNKYVYSFIFILQYLEEEEDKLRLILRDMGTPMVSPDVNEDFQVELAIFSRWNKASGWFNCLIHQESTHARD